MREGIKWSIFAVETWRDSRLYRQRGIRRSGERDSALYELSFLPPSPIAYLSRSIQHPTISGRKKKTEKADAAVRIRGHPGARALNNEEHPRPRYARRPRAGYRKDFLGRRTSYVQEMGFLVDDRSVIGVSNSGSVASDYKDANVPVVKFRPTRPGRDRRSRWAVGGPSVGGGG